MGDYYTNTKKKYLYQYRIKHEFYLRLEHFAPHTKHNYA